VVELHCREIRSLTVRADIAHRLDDGGAHQTFLGRFGWGLSAAGERQGNAKQEWRVGAGARDSEKWI
jgi:hypothetical protein